MILKHQDLSAFVEETDRLGGPGSAGAKEYWENFQYLPTYKVDVALAPESEKYLSQMILLYEEISGRTLDPAVTELSSLDVDSLALLESPYSFATPSERAVHYLRLAKALYVANLPYGAKVLDMGCGWGLSSEFMAQLGLQVTAVDINPLFVDLVTRRARRLDLKISTVCSSFDDFVDDPSKYDAILFYECFHHSVGPRNVLKKLAGLVKMDGTLMLAGEPIQDYYWPHWGLRLDAMSVYCIRKFGWFESGWSLTYLQKMLREAGFVPRPISDVDPSIGLYVVAKRRDHLKGLDLSDFVNPKEWWTEDEFMVSNRAGIKSSLVLHPPASARRIEFIICNYSPRIIDVIANVNGEVRSLVLTIGANAISFPSFPSEGKVNCTFSAASWIPAVVIGNSDNRSLGFHLESVRFHS